MFRIVQIILSLLPLSPWGATEAPLQVPHRHCHHEVVEAPPPAATKSIAIVGAGSGGLAALKTILDLSEETHAGWEVVVYEQRRDIGGVWLADSSDLPSPPELPETPLYPRLHVNTPHPTMTYPNFTFPPGTTLFPGWEPLQQYHAHFAAHFNLTPHIRLNHEVISAVWHGDSVEGDWHVTVHAHENGRTKVVRKPFDHLIVANGHNHYPRVPVWDGTEAWLASTPIGKPRREILHSIYYRDPERYANLSVVLVGAGASARDVAVQVSPLARVYQSISETDSPAPGAQVIPKPHIAYFTADSIVFVDGSTLTDVDAIVLATGYENRVPFLSPPHAVSMLTDPYTTANSTTARALTNNLRYIFPLHRHIFSIAPTHPPTALAFIGLPVLIANCPSDIAQSLFVAHALANASILPSREEMLDELVARETNYRLKGYDPYLVGHRLVGGDTEAQDYQDNLVEYLKEKNAIYDNGKKYVEPWRRWARLQSALMARGWQRVLEQGEEAQWLDGVETEDDWAELMSRLVEWQTEWEKVHGEPVLTGDVFA
ncbi:hypothetical protein AcW1_007265 [Taiwanofungus camphoratus]|nr:hypothetical protein AcW2_007669 [Antrodia cinnamomea]KAI0952907.1 hypothetical protein AcW1_007265 [Antrodia cinnamomea]